jgi:acyl-CoA hydrolase
LTLSLPSQGAPTPEFAKVFCFFSSEKKIFLPLLQAPPMQTYTIQTLNLAAHIIPGDSIVCTQACGEPLTLMETLAAQRHTLPGCNVFVGASFIQTFTPEHTDALRFTSFGALGTNRRLARKAGALGIVPCHVAQLGPYFTAGAHRLRRSCFLQLITARTPTAATAFGATADYVRAAAARARLVIAEINDQAPSRLWRRRPHRRRNRSIAIHTSRPLPQVPAAKPAPTDDLAIAAHAANFIGDNAVLQMGIGATPDAILRKLTDRKNLGFHSGMMSDAVVDLITQGVITNATKPIDPGISITGALIGTDKLYRFAHDNRALALRSAAYTHAAEILARLPTLLSPSTAPSRSICPARSTPSKSATITSAVSAARPITCAPATAPNKAMRSSRYLPRLNPAPPRASCRASPPASPHRARIRTSSSPNSAPPICAAKPSPNVPAP